LFASKVDISHGKPCALAAVETLPLRSSGVTPGAGDDPGPDIEVVEGVEVEEDDVLPLPA